MSQWLKRQSVLILVLSVLMTLLLSYGISQSVYAEDEETTVTVNVLTQKDANTVLKAFTDLSVKSDTAESYGFTEPEKVRDPDENAQIPLKGKVTTLDVLAEVMHQLYGDQFTAETAQSYIAVNSAGTLTKIFGETTTLSGFTINGENPLYQGKLSYGAVGSLIDDSIVEDGDSIRFFRTLEDDFELGGLYSSMFFFENLDQAEYQAVAGTPFKVNVSVDYAFANMLVSMGGGPELDPVDAVVSMRDENGNEVATADVDDEGTAELQCNLPGEYSLVVSEYDGNAFDEHFVSSYAKVNVALPEESTAKVQTAVRNFEKNNKFDVIPQEIEVSSNKAEDYGDYRDLEAGNAGKVTLADLLYTMHEKKYGSSFTKDSAADYLVSGDTGYLSKCFGVSTFSISYLINQDLSMTGGIFEIALGDGDQVDLYKYLDETNYSDLMSYYDESEVTAKTYEPFTLQLEGIGWNYTGKLQKSANQSIVAALYDDEGNVTAIKKAIMDKDGKVNLTFYEPGTYHVTAYGCCNAPVTDYSTTPPTTSDADVPIILPYCTVTVTANEDVTEEVTSAYDAINKIGDVSLLSEADIKAAEEAYNKLTDEQKALIPNYEDLLKAKVTLAELQLEAAKEKNNSTSSDLTKAQNKLTKAQKAFKDYRTVQKKKVTKVKVKAGKKKATISWKSLGKGYTYTVYQLNPKTGAYKAVKTTKKTKVVVKKLKKGKKYFFKVQAKKKVGGYVALTKESKVVKSKKIK